MSSAQQPAQTNKQTNNMLNLPKPKICPPDSVVTYELGAKEVCEFPSQEEILQKKWDLGGVP